MVLDGLSQDNLRRFLRYITGMVAIPLDGMGKPIIVQCQPKSDHLPSAHTCSFQLDLPDYDELETTKQKVLKMLEWLDAGFAFV
jgi:E3 ubiquitin-protein ligase HUWE1